MGEDSPPGKADGLKDDDFEWEISMRIPSSVFVFGRYALALAAITASVVLMSAQKKTTFTPFDKAYYASEATVDFVRPGLTLTLGCVSRWRRDHAPTRAESRTGVHRGSPCRQVSGDGGPLCRGRAGRHGA